MRRFSLLIAMLSGCLHQAHISVDRAVLGRVVVYRNGVAYYERKATVIDGKLAIHVPRERVDDFLKSLTVLDPATHKPLSVSIPRKEGDDGSYLTMTLETPNHGRADVLLTYVTEAPAWKPSYRVVVKDQGKVELEGWAIVDNVSGEDWKGVLVGVGASSALSFRYDLWSVRRIDRDLLQGEDRFAVAPPAGVSPYAEASAATEELVQLDGTEVRGDADPHTTVTEPTIANADPTKGAIRGVVHDARTGAKLGGVTVIATSPILSQALTAISAADGSYKIDGLPRGTYLVTFYYGDITVEHDNVKVERGRSVPVYQALDDRTARGETVKIQSAAPTIDPTSVSGGKTLDKNYLQNIPKPDRTFDAALSTAAGSQGDALGVSFSGSSSLENQYYVDGSNAAGLTSGSSKLPPPPPPVKQGDAKLHGIVAKVLQNHKDVVIEAHGATAAEVGKRAEAVRNQLVDDGVPIKRIHIVPKVGANESRNVRVLATSAHAETSPAAVMRAAMPDTPVGESHFMSDVPMNVRAGSSAMVSMVHGETAGGVVYLYDPISDRGDQRFAFKAVRLDNPTADTLEPGPVTVYGDGRFIGEGITEPVPPHASVVVPFALDRQIVISRNGAESDRIAKLVTVHRGVITAELQHRRQTHFTITSRLTEATKVFVRHRLESGWALVDAPSAFMKVGDSQLFEVDLDPGETKYVTIAEATPVERKLTVDTDEAFEMIKLYIDEPDVSTDLKAQLGALLATHGASADLTDKIQTLRDQLADYRVRSGELHAQLVTLKAVRTGGDLMTALRSKLVDTSDRIQKATIALVDAQEQLMLTRVKLQNQLAELHIADATAQR